MPNNPAVALAAVLAALLAAAPLQAQPPGPGRPPAVPALPAVDAQRQAPPSAAPRAEAPPDPRAETTSQTRHAVRIGGQEIRYTATAGTLPLADGTGKARAHLFYVAYTRDAVGDPSGRPITFAYNGGPGSASIWLHMGTLGPRRVQMADEGFQPSPPYRLVDNEESILDLTDVVMIDPVSTGFSRAAAGEDAKQFHGTTPDIQSVAEFIRIYLTRYQRWSSPKFLFGESYGTTRSAGLAAELQQRHGIELNGIVLVSAVVDYGPQEYAPGHDLAYATYFPTLAATAWYHKKVAPDLQGDLRKTVEAARTFALGEYLVAMARGNRLAEAEREALAGKMARFIGLSPEFILQCNLRVSDVRFRKQLLRGQRLTIGRLDGRFTALDEDAAGERQEFDPSNTALLGAYTALFNDYVRRELKYENDLKYETSGAVRPWSWSEFENRYVNMTEPLRGAMARNPFLRIFVANGYFDMATPFFSTEYTFDHLGFDDTYKDRVSMGYYEAGHMMYIRPSAHAAFKRDVAAFYKSCLPSR